MFKAVKKVVDFLKGKKTYITGIVIAVIAALEAFNVIKLTPDQYQAVLAVLAAVGLVALRAGVSK